MPVSICQIAILFSIHYIHKNNHFLAWYEAQRKKRPRSPNADNSANEDNRDAKHHGKSRAKKRDEGTY
jgi:hypothetical protein